MERRATSFPDFTPTSGELARSAAGRWGDKPLAILGDDRLTYADAGPELATALIDHCRQHLAHYKAPRSVDFVVELPRDPNGKMYKRQLRERYWADRASRIM